MNVKDVIKANPVSTFLYYRKKELYYSCGDFVFRVPISDTGDGKDYSIMDADSVEMHRRMGKINAIRGIHDGSAKDTEYVKKECKKLCRQALEAMSSQQ